MYYTEKIKIITLGVGGTEQVNVRSAREKTNKQQNKTEIHITWFANSPVHEKHSDSWPILSMLLRTKLSNQLF